MIWEAPAPKLGVVVWTVDTSEDMERLTDRGVDGIISGRPDMLRDVAARKGDALPAACR